VTPAAHPQQPPPPGPPPADPGAPALNPNALGFRQPAPGGVEAAGRITSTTGSYSGPTLTPPPPQLPGYTPYGYNNPWGFSTPTGAMLDGSANIIAAQGQYRVAAQQSRLIGESVKSAQLDNQRKALEEWLYERSITPTLEDERERKQYEQLRHSRNQPAPTEIWSAVPLNDLLASIQKSQVTGAQGPPVPVPPEAAGRINYTSGTTYRGTGMLKPGGALDWPPSLDDTPFDDLRNKTSKLVQQGVAQAMAGRVEPRLIRELDRTIDALEDEVRAQIQDMTPSDNIEAKRYLKQLKESCGVFKQTDPASYFAAGAKPQAATIGALVDQMNAKGLRFAPAVAGQEEAYNSFYRALMTYEAQLSMMVGRAPPR
jgi:hypothetical protein